MWAPSCTASRPCVQWSTTSCRIHEPEHGVLFHVPSLAFYQFSNPSSHDVRNAMSVVLRCTGLPRILHSADWLPAPEKFVLLLRSRVKNCHSSGCEAERTRVFFLAHRPGFEMWQAWLGANFKSKIDIQTQSLRIWWCPFCWYVPGRTLPCALWLRFCSPSGTLWTVCLFIAGCSRIMTISIEIECMHWVTLWYPLGASWDWIYSSECLPSMTWPRFRRSSVWNSFLDVMLKRGIAMLFRDSWQEFWGNSWQQLRTTLKWTGIASHAFGGSLSKLESKWRSLECLFCCAALQPLVFSFYFLWSYHRVISCLSCFLLTSPLSRFLSFGKGW